MERFRAGRAEFRGSEALRLMPRASYVTVDLTLFSHNQPHCSDPPHSPC